MLKQLTVTEAKALLEKIADANSGLEAWLILDKFADIYYQRGWNDHIKMTERKE